MSRNPENYEHFCAEKIVALERFIADKPSLRAGTQGLRRPASTAGPPNRSSRSKGPDPVSSRSSIAQPRSLLRTSVCNEFAIERAKLRHGERRRSRLRRFADFSRTTSQRLARQVRFRTMSHSRYSPESASVVAQSQIDRPRRVGRRSSKGVRPDSVPAAAGQGMRSEALSLAVTEDSAGELLAERRDFDFELGMIGRHEGGDCEDELGSCRRERPSA